MMSTDDPLPAGSDELLYRQVHPNFAPFGRPSSQAFSPTKKDNYQLSVDRSSSTTPKDAFVLHTEGRGLKSAGTWAVTVAECTEKHLGCFPDPLFCPPEIIADPAHCRVDFSSLSSDGRRQIAGQFLATAAHSRGCLFRAPETA